MGAVLSSQVESEYRALAERCGLVDRSERGKLALSGLGAREFLNGQVTNELLDLHPGEGRYAAFLTHKGKMLGDLRILAIGDNQGDTPSELLLDTERVALQALFDMIRRFKVGFAVELHKRTLESGIVSLVGPESRAVAARALDAADEPGPAEVEHPDGEDIERLGLAEVEHYHRAARIAGHAVRLVATDHAGIDVIFEAPDREAVWEALLGAGAQPVEEPAAEIVRVERGRPRYGIDIDDNTIPQEATLNERAVSFTKGCYVGQETVARLFYKGKPNRHLRGLRLSEPLPAGGELRLGERTVGQLSSSVHSPHFGAIGLALVRREAEPGVSVSVGEHGAAATVVELPFALETDT
jgi:folate-binding protein YgfZ